MAKCSPEIAPILNAPEAEPFAASVVLEITSWPLKVLVPAKV
jgi:hypothetical protein